MIGDAMGIEVVYVGPFTALQTFFRIRLWKQCCGDGGYCVLLGKE